VGTQGNTIKKALKPLISGQKIRAGDGNRILLPKQ